MKNYSKIFQEDNKELLEQYKKNKRRNRWKNLFRFIICFFILFTVLFIGGVIFIHIDTNPHHLSIEQTEQSFKTMSQSFGWLIMFILISLWLAKGYIKDFPIANRCKQSLEDKAKELAITIYLQDITETMKDLFIFDNRFITILKQSLRDRDDWFNESIIDFDPGNIRFFEEEILEIEYKGEKYLLNKLSACTHSTKPHFHFWINNNGGTINQTIEFVLPL